MDIHELIKKAGGTLPLAEVAGVNRTTVLDWKRTGRIPGSRVARISAELDIPVNDLIALVAERAPRKRVAA